ncbi:DUF350 domain-containing protein [Psychrobium sp. 1_MG-2023]|uniref:DUF350 domain-containing protein n=1 Tax=Psychrobium sp. 1_MG-2023 TaxID=3062624 RepID=UPI000C3490A2|nr:DUF350 domain-containing protein [Psychrobium sp. 1_MG-2023]MDP2562248.1 DUF350 domain-containing protein [Psychrobium sp. 1_MG-2023]PKF57498.1 hypothetical protein CW748_06295 [Alteromonadales bacterium alter-6D02]
MEQLQQFINHQPHLLGILAIDIVIAIVLLLAMRFISGLWAGVDTTNELAQKDNFAFGISLAGSLLALAIVMTGAISGESGVTFAQEAIGMTIYGTIGLLLIKIGRIAHDKWALPGIDKAVHIEQGNIGVAIIDAAAVIATALIIRATLLWAHDLDLNTFIAIITGFIISQGLLVLMTRLRERAYKKANQGALFQEAIAAGQTALAIRHAGFLIATGFTLTGASNFLEYHPNAYVENALGWVLFGVAMMSLLYVLVPIVKRLVLSRINLTEEVDHQHNIGVAALEFVISLCVALILMALMA